MPVTETENMTSELVRKGLLDVVEISPARQLLLEPSTTQALEQRLIASLMRLHGERPRQRLIPRSDLLFALEDLKNDGLVAALLDRLTQSGKVVAEGASLTLPGRGPKLSRAESKLKDTIIHRYRLAKLSPPEPDEIAAEAGVKTAVVKDLTDLLAEEGLLVPLGGGLYLDAGAHEAMIAKVSTRLEGGASLKMSELRDLLGTTRKYSVPIGEYLDRIKLTVREGEARRLFSTQKPAAPASSSSMEAAP